MPFIIFLLLISAEIASIVVVGSRLGILGTLALQAFAMLLGLTAFRHIGFVLRPQAREDGTLAREAIGVLLVALSAIALLIPGFFLDIPALLLLLPPVRNAVAGTLARRGFESVQWPGGPATGGQRPGGP
ncbi:MAG: FxsA family protein, partial [Hyphomicrobiaceae bacterium]|nr:FxsA family protein [Hyphomicrobiaceae bacterium]